MVNKLPDALECPVDLVLLNFIDTHLDFYHHLGFTPNMITTLSIICGLGSAFSIYRHNYGLGALLFVVAYYFDCVDGKLARKYNMHTAFGDYYDHLGDMVKFIAVIYVLYFRKGVKLKSHQRLFIPIIYVLCFLTFLQIGYQETIYARNESQSLSVFKYLASLDATPRDTIQLTRYFGNGTFILAFVLIIILWNQK